MLFVNVIKKEEKREENRIKNTDFQKKYLTSDFLIKLRRMK